MAAVLIDQILDRPVLGMVQWTKNNTVPTFPHGLIHLQRPMQSEIFVYESPLKSRIGYSVICVEHMLNKHAIG
jgi:hypothetical protein